MPTSRTPRQDPKTPHPQNPAPTRGATIDVEGHEGCRRGPVCSPHRDPTPTRGHWRGAKPRCPPSPPGQRDGDRSEPPAPQRAAGSPVPTGVPTRPPGTLARRYPPLPAALRPPPPVPTDLHGRFVPHGRARPQLAPLPLPLPPAARPGSAGEPAPRSAPELSPLLPPHRPSVPLPPAPLREM